jgi:hypothetical protein
MQVVIGLKLVHGCETRLHTWTAEATFQNFFSLIAAEMEQT